jgi:hypothetical protein
LGKENENNPNVITSDGDNTCYVRGSTANTNDRKGIWKNSISYSLPKDDEENNINESILRIPFTTD